ncbi:MAG: uroporphyrinogen-III decarboxylase [Chloroflexi bacterium]|nr:uroporphyrinogen-III decarboxylase [Chloroflexota bacterium]MCL5109709.1 uroporphyrinogen-III decarboxylase [Chloroflexota bacterium]
MSARMTHRERVRAALSHQEPDRVPIDLSGAAGDAITAIAYRNLLDYLGYRHRPIKIDHHMSQTALVDEDILRRFDVDFRRVELGGADAGDVTLPDDAYRDEWGVVRQRPPGGYYYDLIPGGSPLGEIDTIAGLDNYRWPDPLDPGRFRGLRERAKELHENTDFSVVLVLNCSFFLRCAELRGWENFFMDVAGDAPFAEALMDRYLAIKLAIAGKALEEAGEFADVVVCTTDDFGSTDRLLVSPTLWRRLIKPRFQQTFDFFKARTDAFRFFHCDGAIYPLMADFVECGVQAINPVQVSAAGMGDTKKLKAEFGDALTFWGAIDTHHVLPAGKPEDVRREVKQRIADLGPGGGYVVCTVHNIQPEVPPENVVAIYDAVNEFGWYPLKP